MKKISKKVQSTKVNENSLNGETLKNIKGGFSNVSTSGNTDRVCSGGCGPSAAYLIVKR